MYNYMCAAKGNYGSRGMLYRSAQRAAVNVYRTDTSFEMLVFAPGRIKDHFKIDVKGNELNISYTPPEGFPRPDWVLREYSRGGFVRSVARDPRVDTSQISGKYVDGVLQVSMPLMKGEETPGQEVKIA